MNKFWQDEFDVRFRRWILEDGEENYGLYKDDWDAVKQFITNLLQEIADEVEELKVKPHHPWGEPGKENEYCIDAQDGCEGCEQVSRNESLDQALSIIQRYKK